MEKTKRARRKILGAREYFLTHQRTISESFNWAIEGLAFTLKTQKNMRFHFAAAFAVLVASLFFNLSRLELVAVLFAITIVIITELLNTAVEVAVDLAVGEDKSDLAKMAKDVAAAAVLVAAMNAVFVAFIIFFKRINPMTVKLIEVISYSPEYLSGIAAMIVFGASLALKVIIGEGTPARGGWPSVHSAMAGSLFSSITIVSKNLLVGTLAFLLALLVFQARVEKEIHTWFEVVSGAILGITITVLLFQIFYF